MQNGSTQSRNQEKAKHNRYKQNETKSTQWEPLCDSPDTLKIIKQEPQEGKSSPTDFQNPPKRKKGKNKQNKQETRRTKPKSPRRPLTTQKMLRSWNSFQILTITDKRADQILRKKTHVMPRTKNSPCFFFFLAFFFLFFFLDAVWRFASSEHRRPFFTKVFVECSLAHRNSFSKKPFFGGVLFGLSYVLQCDVATLPTNCHST